jgi:hypothetical protein
VLDGWQVQAPRPLDETVCRVWGGNGSVESCVLEGAGRELTVDVVEVRVIAPRFEHGCRLPAHGTLTIDVRSDLVWQALREMARSGAPVVLHRPGGGAFEMRFGDLGASRPGPRSGGSATRAPATLTWLGR